MNAVLGWTQLLKMGGLNEDEIAAALNTIEENALLQAQLIEDMLDISRIIHNKLSVNLLPLNLLHPVVSAS